MNVKEEIFANITKEKHNAGTVKEVHFVFMIN